MFYTDIETLCGKERAIKLLSYLLIVSIKYLNFHSAFKPSLLVHMSFFKAIYCLSYYGVSHMLHSVSEI